MMTRVFFLLYLCLSISSQAVNAGSLHDAAERGDIQQVKALIKQGVAIDVKDEAGNTALHWAAYEDNVELVTYLLDAGAPINARNDLGVTPLILAVYQKRTKVPKLLVRRGADPNIRDADRSSALSLAWKREHWDLVRTFIKHGADPNLPDEQGNPPLVLAAREGHADLLLWLIEHGADANVRGRHNTTALHEAAHKANTKMIEDLLKHGADVNARKQADYTPIYYAIMSKDLETVQLLIDHGADVNAKCKHGDPYMRTPLAFAKSNANERKRPDDLIVAVLLRHGARLPDEPIECITQKQIQQMNRLSNQDRLVYLKGKEAQIFVEVVFFWEYHEHEPFESSRYDTVTVWALKRHHVAPMFLFKDGCVFQRDTGFIGLDDVPQLRELSDLIVKKTDRTTIRSALRKLTDDDAKIARFEKRLDNLMK